MGHSHSKNEQYTLLSDEKEKNIEDIIPSATTTHKYTTFVIELQNKEDREWLKGFEAKLE
jgi:hypothetical protein